MLLTKVLQSRWRGSLVDIYTLSTPLQNNSRHWGCSAHISFPKWTYKAVLVCKIEVPEILENIFHETIPINRESRPLLSLMEILSISLSKCYISTRMALNRYGMNRRLKQVLWSILAGMFDKIYISWSLHTRHTLTLC